MNKQIRNIGVLILVLAGLVAFSGGAYAAAPQDGDSPTIEETVQRLMDAEDPEGEFTQLTPAQQEEVVSYFQVTTIVYTTSVSNDANDADCDYNSKTETGTSRLGNTLWRYTSRTYWCWDGSEITNDPHFTRNGQPVAPFWEFVGHLDKSESGGEGDWEHRDYTEGHFRLCFPLLGCFENAYPNITKVQYGDGTSDSW